MQSGRFITLEGGEGTGKSTLMAGLASDLRARGLSVIETREPGGTLLAERVRAIALDRLHGDEWSPLAQALLMNAARDHHLNAIIRPALQRGAWVLCDRFIDSTCVYQGVAGVAKPVLEQFERAVTGGQRPDLTLILDAPPETLVKRRRARDESDIFEMRPMPFHEKIRAAFLAIIDSEPTRCRMVDATQSADIVLKDSLFIIDSALGLP